MNSLNIASLYFFAAPNNYRRLDADSNFSPNRYFMILVSKSFCSFHILSFTLSFPLFDFYSHNSVYHSQIHYFLSEMEKKCKQMGCMKINNNKMTRFVLFCSNPCLCVSFFNPAFVKRKLGL